MNHFHTVIALYLEQPPKPGSYWNWQLCKCHYKKPGLPKRGCRGGALPFPRWENVPFLIFGKYLRYLKKSLYVRFMRRKLQIMNSLKRVRPQTPAARPSPTHIVPPSLQKTDIVYSIFRGIISFPYFYQKLRGLTVLLKIDERNKPHCIQHDPQIQRCAMV